jgi:DNA-binding cell septation regulator SpoVG
MPVKTEEGLTLEAKIRLYHETQGKAELLGFADLVIGEAFVIKGIRIVAVKNAEGERGEPFVSFPSRKGAGQDKYFDIAHPITPEAHQRSKEVILAAYREASAQAR